MSNNRLGQEAPLRALEDRVMEDLAASKDFRVAQEALKAAKGSHLETSLNSLSLFLQAEQVALEVARGNNNKLKATMSL